MGDAVSYEGKVALITGAGGGLGLAHAKLLASRGCKVVVNDLGGATDGTGSGNTMAEKACEEIKAAGGEAVPNYDSVAETEGAENMVKTAVDSFGRLDIVINNAGILRDMSFMKHNYEHFDILQKVHLYGSFLVTRAAWPQFREQNYGRVVMTTSAAGLYGNFGQVNYSAAKMGIYGLMNTLKHEGAKYNIKVNTIAPIAGSRMTAQVLPPQILEKLLPEYVATVVGFLASDQCDTSGGVFSCGGGYVSYAQIFEGKGVKFDGDYSIEDVRDKIGEIMDMSAAAPIENAAMAGARAMG